MMSQIFNYIILTRPINCFITLVTVLIGGVVVSSSEIDFKILLLASISAALIAGAGNIINDIYDLEIDKIAHPNRPLPFNKISVTNAIIFYFALNIISIALILQTYLDLILISIAAILLLYAYSKFVKKIFVLSNITVAFLTGLTFIYAGVAVNNIKDSFLPALFAFMINLIREIVKDVEDYKGDAQYGVKSIPIVLGFDNTKTILYSLILILFIITIIPYLIRYYSIEYFIVIMILVNPLLVYSYKLISHNFSEKNLKVVSGLLKINMILGLIAIYFGK